MEWCRRVIPRAYDNIHENKKLKQVRHISVLTHVSTRRFHQNKLTTDIGAFLLVKNNTGRLLIGLGKET